MASFPRRGISSLRCFSKSVMCSRISSGIPCMLKAASRMNPAVFLSSASSFSCCFSCSASCFTSFSFCSASARMASKSWLAVAFFSLVSASSFAASASSSFFFVSLSSCSAFLMPSFTSSSAWLVSLIVRDFFLSSSSFLRLISSLFEGMPSSSSSAFSKSSRLANCLYPRMSSSSPRSSSWNFA